MKCPSAGESGCCAVGRSPCGERGLKYKRPKKAYHRLTSLPVRGAWIEIRWTTCTTTTRQSRSPCGERGLKSGGFWKVRPDTPSLPVRGAWIEIVLDEKISGERSGRSPCGERGLKLLFANCNPVNRESLPVRGAWIEIRYTNSANNTSKSLPVRGAWIEITPSSTLRAVAACRSPCGERGLKLCAVTSEILCGHVAPRAGSVD